MINFPLTLTLSLEGRGNAVRPCASEGTLFPSPRWGKETVESIYKRLRFYPLPCGERDGVRGKG
ncbi:hypothetical protein TUM17576_05760 [Enterobacter hormaechei]|nr:hypothetical protein TUM17576_05760 [Enterobacter hormaechei]